MTTHPLPNVLRRPVLLALLLLALAALAWAFWPRAIEVELAAARIGRFEQTLEEDGRLRAVHRYAISAPVAATLLRPTLKVGDRVEAGQVLAQLVPLPPQMIDARSRSMLQERVGGAEAAQAAARAQLGQAQAAADRAALESGRVDRLAGERFVSPSAQDEARLALQVQRKALESAQAQVHQAEHALAEARAALQRAEGRGDRLTGLWPVTSPVAGEIVRLHHESATAVPAGEALMEIADTAQLEAVVDVLSGDALRVKPGAPVRLALGSGLPELPGRVERIEPVAFTKVSALGIEEQRVNLIVAPTAAAPVALGDGYRVDARITIEVRDDALLVPAGALLRDGSAWAVMVFVDGRARRRTVEVAARNGDWAWLRGGLEPAERVLLYPGATITDGQRIRERRTPP